MNFIHATIIILARLKPVLDLDSESETLFALCTHEERAFTPNLSENEKLAFICFRPNKREKQFLLLLLASSYLPFTVAAAAAAML